ncbi:hypothetical protein N7481_006847, partial [Penicillium waksmanii]|uniref:uncharacterized protein n=1 Tax=Penicillium waksmanii TaxID=69791 RepID=UPI0025477467
PLNLTKDITLWLFCYNPEIKDFNDPVLIDVEQPSCSYTYSTANYMCVGFRKPSVCVHSFNDIDYPVLVNGIIGAWRGGGVARNNDCLNLILHRRLKNLLEAAQQVGLPCDHDFIFDQGSEQSFPMGFPSWCELLEHGEQDWESFDDEHRSRNTTVTHCFSSGTTGLLRLLLSAIKT